MILIVSDIDTGNLSHLTRKIIRNFIMKSIIIINNINHNKSYVSIIVADSLQNVSEQLFSFSSAIFKENSIYLTLQSAITAD